MSEVLLPPWVQPISPEHVGILDDQTTTFEASLGRAPGQTQSWADPRWQIKRSFKTVRLDERAALRSALAEARGRGNIVRATVYQPLRGSFPTQELCVNPTFANGTTGWSATAQNTLSVSDRTLRVQRAQNTTTTSVSGTALTGLTQYASYVMRALALLGRGPTQYRAAILDALDGTVTGAALTPGAMSVFAYVLQGTTATPIIRDESIAGAIAGDYFDVPFTSFARCILVDNGPNYLQQSDAIDDAAWTTKLNVTISANNTTAADGTLTMDGLIENSTNGAHNVEQAQNVPSTALDYIIYTEVTPGNRSFCYLEMDEGGATTVLQYFNLSTGAVGVNGSTGAGWANRRAGVKNLGNNRYFIWMIARKSSSATTIKAYIGPASADGTGSYTGNGSGTSIALRRAGIAQSSVPTRGGLTTSTALANGTTQSGAGLYLKALPASTNGLLLKDDWFEINGELKQCTAVLNSDEAGLGYLQFRPMLAGSPADGDPIIVSQPMGRFRLMNSYEYDDDFGLYLSTDVELTETYG